MTNDSGPRADRPSRRSTPGRSLALLLASLIALTPLAIDAYLPALPAMAAFFAADIQVIEISISTFFFGYATGQLTGAPFSDGLGRRPVILFGLSVFMLASLLITGTSSVEQLLVLRFVQAFGGGCAAVNAAAIVRDQFDEDDSARMLATIGLIMMAAPLVAPALGAAILWQFEWQAIFIVLTLYAAVLAVVLARCLAETNAPLRRDESAPPRRHLLGNYLRVFRHRQALGLMLGASFAAGNLFIFLTDAAFAYMEYFAVSTTLFPILFGLNVISMMLLTRLNLYLLLRSGPRRMIRAGMLLQVSVTLVFAVYVSAFEPRLAVVVALVVLAIGANGLILSNSLASFLSYFATGSGSANALFSTSSFTIGGLLGALLGLVHDGTLKTLAYGMCVSACLGLLANLTLLRRTSA